MDTDVSATFVEANEYCFLFLFKKKILRPNQYSLSAIKYWSNLQFNDFRYSFKHLFVFEARVKDSYDKYIVVEEVDYEKENM